MTDDADAATFDFDTVFDRTRSENSKWRRYPAGVLPMHVADMDFRSPPAVIATLAARVEHGFFGYGTPQPEFFEVVAARLQRRYGWTIDPAAIVLLPGVIAGLHLTATAFARPGDSILLQTPAYPPILHCNEPHGLGRDEVVLLRGEDGRYGIDWPAFEAAIGPTTRIAMLCNPHNPTGRVFTHAELERTAALCLDHDLVICSDEIHCDLVYAGHPHVPIASLDPAVAARTVTLMAPSKTFNLPGLKCSIAVIPDADMRQRFEAARAGLVGAVNVLGYVAALAAYRDGDGWLASLLDYLEANRQFVADFVRQQIPSIRLYPPEGTYLAWMDCRALPVSDPAAFFLEHARVGLNDGATFGEAGRGFVRLNFACPRSLLADGLSRVQRAVAAL